MLIMYRGTRSHYHQHGSQTIVVPFIRVQSLNVPQGDLTLYKPYKLFEFREKAKVEISFHMHINDENIKIVQR